MKAYIAAPYPERDHAIRIMRMLEIHGVDVTSSWLRAPDKLSDEFARVDLADVARADVLVALNPNGWNERGTGGRHVEFGYALALGKPIVLVGERSNIFHHLDNVKVIDDSEDITKQVKLAAAVRFNIEERPRTVDSAIRMVLREVLRAESKHKPMNSPHEGYAVILEELDELWDEIKADRGRSDDAMAEAKQVAAMGIRYMVNLSARAPREEPASVEVV